MSEKTTPRRPPPTVAAALLVDAALRRALDADVEEVRDLLREATGNPALRLTAAGHAKIAAQAARLTKKWRERTGKAVAKFAGAAPALNTNSRDDPTP